MTTSDHVRTDRYEIDPQTDCLVVATAPPALFSGGNEEAPKHSSKRFLERHRKKKTRRHIKGKDRKAQRDDFKRQGDAAFQAGRYAEAVEQYTHALALDPTSHVILSNRSAAHYKQGNKSKALYDAHASVEENPNFFTGVARLAATLQSLRQWDHALDAYKRMLELDPSNEIAKTGIEGCTKRIQAKERKRNKREHQPPQKDSSEEETDADVAPPHETTVALSSGMCELSKQLRTLQATNEAQASQIERLERQLQIMTDLKGISLPDLRCELQTACQMEAHSELQAQVASLRSQLDTVTRLNTSEKDVAAFEKESSANTIATLQLRVGELEEIEFALRDENTDLYRSLREETSKVAMLTSTCEQQRKENRKLVKKLSLNGKSETDQGAETQDDSYALHAEIDRLTDMLRDAELQVKLEMDRANLLEEESEARQSMAELRTQQFNCRLNIQDERVKDLEQQVSSLYAGFEIFREDDQTGEPQSSAAAHIIPSDIDSQVARQLQAEINNENSFVSAAQVSTVPHYSTDTLSDMPSAWTNARDAILPEKVVSGFLWCLDMHGVSGWSKRYFVLQGSFGNYQLCCSEGPRQKVRCDLGSILTGVSTVAQCKDFDDQQFALVLHINPHDAQAPVVYAAASCQHNLNKWLDALTVATTGHIATPTESEGSGEVVDLETALKYQKMELTRMKRRHSCH